MKTMQEEIDETFRSEDPTVELSSIDSMLTHLRGNYTGFDLEEVVDIQRRVQELYDREMKD